MNKYPGMCNYNIFMNKNPGKNKHENDIKRKEINNRKEIKENMQTGVWKTFRNDFLQNRGSKTTNLSKVLFLFSLRKRISRTFQIFFTFLVTPTHHAKC